MSATNEVQLLDSATGSRFLIPCHPQICQFYRRLDVETVLAAWCVEVVSESRHDSVPMTIKTPGGWRAEEVMNNDALRSWFITDKKGNRRMHVVHSRDRDSAMAYLKSPVEMQLNDNEDFTGYKSKKPRKAWVEVLHHGKMVFRSAEIPSAEINLMDDRANRQLEPLFQQAKGFIKKEFPLLFSDPAAYW